VQKKKDTTRSFSTWYLSAMAKVSGVVNALTGFLPSCVDFNQ
jgi:hypothetical protein